MYHFYENDKMIHSYEKLRLALIVEDYEEKIRNDYEEPERLEFTSIVWVSENDNECKVSLEGVMQVNRELENVRQEELMRRRYA